MHRSNIAHRTTIMHRVNFSPWRKDRNQKLKRHFFLLAIVFIIFTLSAQFFITRYFQSKIVNIQSSLARLDTIQQPLNLDLMTLIDLEEQQQEQLEKISQFLNIHNSKHSTALVLTELPILIPEDVFLERLSIQREEVVLKGVSNDVNWVSVFAGALKESPVFFDLNIDSIASRKKDSKQHDFSFSFRVVKESDLK